MDSVGILGLLGLSWFFVMASRKQGLILEAHILRLLGLKTILYKAFGPF